MMASQGDIPDFSTANLYATEVLNTRDDLRRTATRGEGDTMMASQGYIPDFSTANLYDGRDEYPRREGIGALQTHGDTIVASQGDIPDFSTANLYATVGLTPATICASWHSQETRSWHH